jgi:hypothetical protein
MQRAHRTHRRTAHSPHTKSTHTTHTEHAHHTYRARTSHTQTRSALTAHETLHRTHKTRHLTRSSHRLRSRASVRAQPEIVSYAGELVGQVVMSRKIAGKTIFKLRIIVRVDRKIQTGDKVRLGRTFWTSYFTRTSV